VLQEVLVQWMSDVLPTDERECKDFFTIAGDFDDLALEEIDVQLETFSLSPLDGEEMVDISLGLLARGVLGEKCLGYL